MLRIGEVARLVGVSPSTLRNWESEGLVTPARIQGRTRYYTAAQVEQLRRIHHLRAVEGLNINGIRRVLGDQPPARETGNQRPAGPGPRIAEARRAKGWSMRRLARESGLSVSFLSSLERGLANASLGTLHRIARALGTTALELFHLPRGPRAALVRPDDRIPLEARDPGITLELLTRRASVLEPHLVTLPPGGGTGEAYTHPGEEFLFVLVGTLEVILDEVEIYTLEPGDALTWPSEVAHRLHNPGDEEARAVWVNTPPTF